MTTEFRPALPEPTHRLPTKPPLPPWLRLVALAGFVVLSLVELFTFPIRSDTAHLARSLRTGAVTAVEYGCEVHPVGPRIAIGGPVTAWDVCWREETGLRFTADARNDLAAVNVTGRRVNLTTSVAATARDAGHRPPQLSHTGLWFPYLGLAWLAWLVLLVWVIVTGPQPRRVTKWAAFWVTGVWLVGTLWWLLREAPWSPSASEEPEPVDSRVRQTLDGRQRLGGGWAFLLYIGGSAAVSVVGLSIGSGVAEVVDDADRDSTWVSVFRGGDTTRWDLGRFGD